MREAGIIKDRSFKERSCVGIRSGSWLGFFQQKVFKKNFTIKIKRLKKSKVSAFVIDKILRN